MEERRLNIKEGFTHVFKDGRFIKVLDLIGFVFLTILLLTGGVFLCKYNHGNIIMVLFGVLLLFLTFIAYFILAFYIVGYFITYSHDRALNENAPYKDIKFSTFSEIIINGLKTFVIGLVKLPFMILSILAITPVIIGVIVFKLSPNIITFSYSAFLAIVVGVPITKILSYFMKDLKLESLFSWGDAFRYTKGVKGAFKVAFVPFLINCIVFAGNFLFENLIRQIPYTSPAISITLFIIFYSIIAYSGIVYYNLLGQYTYNAIKMNEEKAKEKEKPEEKPVTVNIQNKNNSTGMIVAICVLAVFFVTLIIMGIVAAITIPTLIQRQAEISTKTKIKKAVVLYEDVAEKYMMINNKKNLKDLVKNDCFELYSYVQHPATKSGCAFTTADGTFWKFNSDGSATISIQTSDGEKNITMGVCKDGTINCPEEFPNIETLKYADYYHNK